MESVQFVLKKSIASLEYCLECNLATVEYMNELSKPNKTQLNRQKSIAQKTAIQLAELINEHNKIYCNNHYRLTHVRSKKLVEQYSCFLDSYLYNNS